MLYRLLCVVLSLSALTSLVRAQPAVPGAPPPLTAQFGAVEIDESRAAPFGYLVRQKDLIPHIKALQGDLNYREGALGFYHISFESAGNREGGKVRVSVTIVGQTDGPGGGRTLLARGQSVQQWRAGIFLSPPPTPDDASPDDAPPGGAPIPTGQEVEWRRFFASARALRCANNKREQDSNSKAAVMKQAREDKQQKQDDKKDDKPAPKPDSKRDGGRGNKSDDKPDNKRDDKRAGGRDEKRGSKRDDKPEPPSPGASVPAPKDDRKGQHPAPDAPPPPNEEHQHKRPSPKPKPKPQRRPRNYPPYGYPPYGYPYPYPAPYPYPDLNLPSTNDAGARQAFAYALQEARADAEYDLAFQLRGDAAQEPFEQ